MARFVTLFCIFACASAVTPLQKVTEMLQGMSATGKAEKHKEEVEFAEFHQFCDSTRASKTKSIADAEAQIVQLTADIQKAEADAEGLAQEIAELEKEIAENEKEAAGAKQIRDSEHKDYMAQHADFSESIDACARAVVVLNARTKDVPQSLLQLQNSQLVPANAKAVIESFLAMQSDASEQAPEANAYEFQSGSVITMLEKLEGKFKDQLLALEKEEMNSKANFEVLLQKLTDDIGADKKSSAEKSGARAGRLEDAATAKGDKEVTETNKAEDEKVLSDTNAECAARSDEFEKNQVVRSDEIKAIAQAVEILSSGAVKGNAEKYLPAAAGASSLVLLRSQAHTHPEMTRAVVEFLQGRAQKLGSKYLSMIATRVQEDPFGKVKKMIKDLIVKLMEEANSEADHHAYCTTELATNKQTRENKAAEVDDLTSESEKLTAETTQLAEEIAQLSDEIAEIKGQQAEATKVRGEEKATNSQTVADAIEAQTAVSRATQILKEFYDSQVELVQEPYKGMAAASGGILGMLEVVLSDFARLEAETSSNEDQAASAYEKFMNENNEVVAVKDTTMKHNENRKSQAEERNRKAKKELELTQEELDAALDYYDKLKADCVDTGLSYADRKKAREEEIQSLKEALTMLDEQDLA